MEPSLPPPPPPRPSMPVQPFGNPLPASPSQAGGPMPSAGPPGYRWQPGGPWVAMVPPRTHGLATAALVCGLVGLLLFVLLAVLPILALTFGLISRSTIARSNGALIGAGRAKAGVALGIVGLVFFGLFAWAAATDRIGGDTDDTSVFDLRVGNCVETMVPENASVVTLPIVECTEPHAAEVFRVTQLNADRDRDYPGDSALQVEADATCLARFEGYVGLPYEESVFEYSLIVPGEESWRASRGEVTCLLFEPGKNAVVGSAYNARR